MVAMPRLESRIAGREQPVLSRNPSPSRSPGGANEIDEIEGEGAAALARVRLARGLAPLRRIDRRERRVARELAVDLRQVEDRRARQRDAVELAPADAARRRG